MKREPGVWRKAYQDDGYVIVPDLIDPATLSALRDGMEKITGHLEGVPPRLREEIFLEREHVQNNPQWYADLTPEECGNSVRQIDNLALFDPVFAELICYPVLLDVLEALFASPELGFCHLTGRPKAARVGNGIRNGNFHRDTPDEDFTSANLMIAIVCLDAMTAENGPTTFIRGSHQVPDEEARQPSWRNVEADELMLERQVEACCPAGSGIFFSTKIIHAAGHNRSGRPRRAIFSEWSGPDALPTSPARHPYQELKPRSKDPVCEKQVKLTFPKLFAG